MRETPAFKVFFREGENEWPLIGVAIVKKHFPKATTRNRAKRICYNLMGEAYSLLRKNLNLVIMPKAAILKVNNEELESSLYGIKDLFKTD